VFFTSDKLLSVKLQNYLVGATFVRYVVSYARITSHILQIYAALNFQLSVLQLGCRGENNVKRVSTQNSDTLKLR